MPDLYSIPQSFRELAPGRAGGPFLPLLFLVLLLRPTAFAPAGESGGESPAPESKPLSPDEAIASPPDGGRSPDAAGIGELIDDLDADRYSVREAASQRLLAAGAAAIPHLVEAAEGESVEVAARAVGALEDLWRNAEPEVSLAALRAMARLDNQLAFSRRAREAVAMQKQIEAVAYLAGLGARPTDSTPRQFGRPEKENRTNPNWMVFGEAFQGTGGDLKRLKDIPSLQRVSFYSKSVRIEDLQVLADVPDLIRLELYGTGLEDHEIAALRGRLLGVTIDARSGALLGVSGDVGAGVARVSGVEEDSAAARAGLQRGDVILRVDDEEVPDFAELTKKIGSFEPGDTADLVVLRNGERIDIEVKFGQWR